MNSSGQKVVLSRVGNYQFTGKCLGKGSFAKVYEAIHRPTNTIVAVKTMNVTEMKDDYMKKHFKREAQLLLKLNHPAIVKLFEVMETRNHYCMALEFGGDNLCDYVRSQKRGRLDENIARAFAHQLASAVSHMHEQGVIHRDIKLENILVVPLTKKVKLSDFGLSNAWDKKSRLSTNCGSPEYAAPELHSGKAYGSEVDIWALGVVLFAMVVGRLPFEVEMKKPVSNQHRRELFLDETKRGVKTMKHQSYMGSASYLFKDVVSKMLNPVRLHRLKIQQVAHHPWVQGVFVEEFPPVTEQWKREAFQNYSKSLNIAMDEVTEMIEKQPYGQLGGTFNIELHKNQLNKITLKRSPAGYRVPDNKSALTNNASAVLHRPITAAQQFISTTNVPARPKTAQSKPGLVKPLERKLRDLTLR